MFSHLVRYFGKRNALTLFMIIFALATGLLMGKAGNKGEPQEVVDLELKYIQTSEPSLIPTEKPITDVAENDSSGRHR